MHPYKKVDEEKGEIKEEWSFDYMALDIIQRYYLHGKIGRHPFMLKMVLPQKECYELAGLLRKIGIKTMKYYPELTNLKE